MSLCALAGILNGHAVQAEPLSLRQVADAVLARNPAMDIARARIQQADAGLSQAEGVRLPRLALSLNLTRTNDALAAFGTKLGQQRVTAADFVPATLNNPAAINNFNTRIELQAPIYTGGQMTARLDEARAHTRAARAADTVERQQLLLDTLKAYQGVHLARAHLAAATQAQAAAQEFARLSGNLHQQGAAVKSDVLSARVHLEESNLGQADANRQLATALDQLKLLMGRPLGEGIEIGAETLPALLAGTDQELRNQALQQHPGLKALREQSDAANANLMAARAAKQPQLSVMARHDWNTPNLGLAAASYTLAGMLSWSAFDGGVTDAAVDRAQAQRAEQLARLRQAEERIAFQVTETHRRALEAEKRLAVRQAALQEAEEAQRLTRIRYQNGITTLVDLLAAQARLDQARAGLAQARYDLATTRGEVLHATGALTLEQL